MCAAGAGAATIYVDAGGGGDYTTIQAGMDAAATGDTVKVASGTYYITDAITYGGKDIFLLSEYGPQNTIIDCQGTTNAVSWNGEGDGAVLLGFTIQNGDFGNGGAVRCVGGAEPTVSNCIIRDCSAARGGGFYIHESSPTLMYTEIRDCTASEWGGAIYCYNSSGAAFVGLIIGNNTAGEGSGMYIWSGAPYVSMCTFYRNSADGSGAIHCRGSSPTILQSILAFSTAGKGLFCQDSANPTITYSDIYGNAGGDGLCGTPSSNLGVDPRFCGIDAGNVELCANSPCLGGAGHNPWGVLIGARGQGCGDCAAPVAPATWGAVKALYR